MTVWWLVAGGLLWCAVSVLVGVRIGRVLATRDRPQPPATPEVPDA